MIEQREERFERINPFSFKEFSDLVAQDWQPVACDLRRPPEGPVTGPVENASAVGVPVAAVVAVGTGVEAGTLVTVVGSALGRVPRETSDRLQLAHAAQQP